MRIFFFLGRTFLDQSLAIAREFKRREPDSEFMALIGARKDTLNFVKKYKDPVFGHIEWLNLIEEKALQMPFAKERLEYYRHKIGDAALRRILISDRELGKGYISCGKYVRTPLINTTKFDNNKRWNVIIGLLDYLFEAFEREKPDIVFSYCIAAAHELAMQIVAEHLGITFAQPVMSHINNYFILDNTSYQTLSVVQHSFNKLLNNEIALADSIGKAKIFLHEFRNKPQAPEYNNKFRAIVENQAKISGMAKTFAVDAARMLAINLGLFGTKGVLRQRNGFDILKENLLVSIASRNALKGKQFEGAEAATGEYIYYPLHVDPEASTMVLSPYHTDQVAVIEAISKQMPAGMKLLVKEHIPSVGRRTNGFYQRIRTMPDVHLISPFVNGFALMQNATLTCVITGTAGKEAILLGKPVLVIGNMHFRNLGDEMVTCDNLANLGGSISAAIGQKPVDEERLIKYIAAIIEEGFEISVNEMWADKNYHDIASYSELAKIMADKLLRLMRCLRH
jgi:hypothetical protein